MTFRTGLTRSAVSLPCSFILVMSSGIFTFFKGPTRRVQRVRLSSMFVCTVQALYSGRCSCSNISLNLVCPRACWRYCLVSLRHELLRKVDCVSSSRDHRPCSVASLPKHTILATLACSRLAKCACCPAAVLLSLQRGAAIFL